MGVSTQNLGVGDGFTPRPTALTTVPQEATTESSTLCQLGDFTF